MKNIKLVVLFLCSILCLQLCSCVHNTPPPDYVYSDSYTTSSVEQYRPLNSETGMTEREAVSTALSNNPEYKVKQLEAVSAESGYYSSLVNLTPNVSINNNTGVTTTYQANPSSVMNVPAAKATADKAQYDTDNYRREMVENVNVTYNDMQKNRSIAAIQMENEKFQKEMTDNALRKNASDSDILNFKINELKAKSAAIEAEKNYKTNSYALAAKMGMTSAELPAGTSMAMPSKGVKNDSNRLQNLNYYLDLAIENRPDLKAHKEALRAAKYDLYSAAGTLAPTVNAATGNFKPSISVSENLNQGSNIAEIRSKDADYAIQQEDLQKKWISVVKEVQEAYLKLTTQLAVRKNLETTMQLTKQRRDLVTQQYNKRKTDTATLNQSQQDYVKAEKAYLDNRVGILKAKADLDAATGVQH